MGGYVGDRVCTDSRRVSAGVVDELQGELTVGACKAEVNRTSLNVPPTPRGKETYIYCICFRRPKLRAAKGEGSCREETCPVLTRNRFLVAFYL